MHVISTIPLKQNRHDSSSINTNLFPSRLSHIKVLERRVAPASIVVWKSIIRGAEICCSNGHRIAFNTPSGVCLKITHNSVTFPT
jgi:UDP-N-acetylglucosamine enolpyruvyl transferase